MKKKNIHFSEQQRKEHIAARNTLEKSGKLSFKRPVISKMG